MQTTMKLKIGHAVKWTSQAGGVFKAKKGKVIAVIAANKPIPAKFAAAARIRTARPRATVSYMVQTAAGKMYLPRTSALKKA